MLFYYFKQQLYPCILTAKYYGLDFIDNTLHMAKASNLILKHP